MTNVARCQEFSRRNWLNCFSNEDAVHNDWGAGIQVIECELVLGGNVRPEKMLPPRTIDGLPLLEIREGDKNVVAWIELESPESQD